MFFVIINSFLFNILCVWISDGLVCKVVSDCEQKWKDSFTLVSLTAEWAEYSLTVPLTVLASSWGHLINSVNYAGLQKDNLKAQNLPAQLWIQPSSVHPQQLCVLCWKHPHRPPSQWCRSAWNDKSTAMLIIIMYIYHALISALSAHIIHIIINLNMIFYTHVEHSPTKTIYIKYYTGKTSK